MPGLLAGGKASDNRRQSNKVLRCDRNMGHTSLHSCFEGLHGAECSTCAKEGYYAYQMTLKGKTVKEIRDGVMRKDFESIDLNAIGL